MKLTIRQQQVLDHLRRQIQTTGLPPTIHELMAAFGWASPSGAVKHLQALAAKGAIQLSPNKARGIRLLEAGDGEKARAVPPRSITAEAPPFGALSFTEDGSDEAANGLSLPLVGRVAAGLPILAGERVERRLVVDRWLFQQRPDFLLRVQGDSMIDDGILDGDLVAGKITPHAEHGQIVIARVGEGITIKRLYRQDGRLRLLPRNVHHAPIDPDPIEDFAIEGIYCGLLRRG
ncbi:MAG: transcriptional repressor LexA [Lautropia sp.]|nr:transcriptional repressor LexA [Lautropia sp.]